MLVLVDRSTVDHPHGPTEAWSTGRQIIRSLSASGRLPYIGMGALPPTGGVEFPNQA